MGKGLALLGATGSIGTQTLDVVAGLQGAFRVVALAGGRNVERLAEQAQRFRPALVVAGDADAATALRAKVPHGTEVAHGPDGLARAARHPEADVVVCAIVGAAGVAPAYAAVDAGKDIALANKEALVAAGAVLTSRAMETGASILPIDSEHNAIHQCLRGEDRTELRRIWLTASGGPFRTREARTLSAVTPDEALRHPTWVMGPKITIDSATLMNKGLEVIEAHWLFGLPGTRIEVVLHPKSVVHSMIEMADGSFKAQLGVTDMRHPIQYALTYPRRLPSSLPPFDPVAAGPLVFEAPDPERFPCLPLAYEALARGGAAPAVLNAANEVAVEAFLGRRAGFLDIPETVRQVLEQLGDAPAGSLDDLLHADRRARAAASKLLECGVKP